MVEGQMLTFYHTLCGSLRPSVSSVVFLFSYPLLSAFIRVIRGFICLYPS